VSDQDSTHYKFKIVHPGDATSLLWRSKMYFWNWTLFLAFGFRTNGHAVTPAIALIDP